MTEQARDISDTAEADEPHAFVRDVNPVDGIVTCQLCGEGDGHELHSSPEAEVPEAQDPPADPEPAEELTLDDERIQVMFDGQTVQGYLVEARKSLAHAKMLVAQSRAGVPGLDHLTKLTQRVKTTRQAVDVLIALAQAIRDGEAIREDTEGPAIEVVERPKKLERARPVDLPGA